MQQQSRSTNLRERLRLPSYRPVDSDNSEFVAEIRGAVRQLPGSGSKRHRVLHAHDNCAMALEGLLLEAVSNGATADDLMRVKAAVSRAVRGLLRRLGLTPSAACIRVAIGAETAANGEQNNASYRVLTSGSIGDCEVFWETSRVQRDLSQSCMDSAEARIAELRKAAAHG